MVENMYNAFISVFGEYAPITNIITVNGAEVLVNSVDYAYIGSVLVFCIAFLSLFRIIGILFKGGK